MKILAAVMAFLVFSVIEVSAQRHEGWRAEGRAERRAEGRVERRVEGRAEGRAERRAEERVEGHARGAQRRVFMPAPGRRARESRASAHDPVVVRNIIQRERVEIVPARYYWHGEEGFRYCHYFDRRIHWYGFYHGPTFYWTRLYGGRWWWFDVQFGRWVYWWDGFWWWRGPGGAAFIYVDNRYTPYSASTATVNATTAEQGTPGTAPQSPPAPESVPPPPTSAPGSSQ